MADGERGDEMGSRVVLRLSRVGILLREPGRCSSCGSISARQRLLEPLTSHRPSACEGVRRVADRSHPSLMARAGA